MIINLDNIFTSGWEFEQSQGDIKSRYQMVNIAIFLSSAGLIYGIIGNYVRNISGFIPLEVFLLCMNVLLFFILRFKRSAFEYVSMIITAQFTFLFIFLIYMSEPDALKHVWLFTYPIILLYFQNKKNGLYWLSIFLFLLLSAPLQSFIEIKYSLFQVTYLAFVLIIVSTIIHFYQVKMDEAKNLILEQQNMLLDFNSELEKQVKSKTSELRELNESLEEKVQDKINELVQKDKILTVQSKQAVMGEMISMIAHQWRQPLSTITLKISNLQFDALLGKEVSQQKRDEVLSEISDTVIYLSETIDDFKTYFHPDKELSTIEIHDLLQKAVNFVLPRVQKSDIEIIIKKEEDFVVETYINELVQVILNILNNAIDVLLKIDRENSKVLLFVENKDDKLLIYISDNGDGVSEEDIGHIFEPYFSTKGKNGTGLGLYMSQMIMQKQFNGDIEIDNSSEGATFIVEIPKNISR